MAISGQGAHHLTMKIGRAYKHLKEFDALYVKYCGGEPYTITKQDDLVQGRHVVRCEFRLLDQDIAMSLSDAVYALRSGLDQLAWQLALIGNNSPSRDTMFPIHDNQSQHSEDIFKKKVWDMPCDAIAVLRDLQPYKRGAAFRDDPLWQLNELSNIDKHRVPAGRVVDGNFTIQPAGWTRVDLDYGVEFHWPLAMKNTVVFQPHFPALIFGDPVDTTNPLPLELTRPQIAEIYRYVREEHSSAIYALLPVIPKYPR